MTPDRTRVYITFDIECAEERLVRGRVQPPLGYDLRIWGRLSNQRRELGIGFIMDELDAAGVKGTFFTESLGAAYFGEDGLRAVCQAIRGRGHDVQLHTHPAQRAPEWRTRGETPPSDDMHAYDTAEQARLMRDAIATLDRCGVPAAELTCFRAGNFAASNESWAAMRECGMRVSSNLNLAYVGGACRVTWPTPENALFDTGAGIWELPISNFREVGGGYRHMQVMAVSLGEMIDYLEKARATGIPEVCIVSHSFEYFYVDSIQERRGRANGINQMRLAGLCRFLRARSRDFEVETVGALAARLPVQRVGAVARTIPTGSRLHKLRRLAEQTFKRFEARLAEVPIQR